MCWTQRPTGYFCTIIIVATSRRSSQEYMYLMYWSCDQHTELSTSEFNAHCTRIDTNFIIHSYVLGFKVNKVICYQLLRQQATHHIGTSSSYRLAGYILLVPRGGDSKASSIHEECVFRYFAQLDELSNKLLDKNIRSWLGICIGTK